MVRIQTHSNSITHIFYMIGTTYTDRADIEHAFLHFYTNLGAEPLDKPF